MKSMLMVMLLMAGLVITPLTAFGLPEWVPFLVWFGILILYFIRE